MEQATTTADPRIIAVDEEGGVYDISSRTRAGLTHTANVLTGVCTCEAGQHNVECWHLDYARAIHFWHRYEERAQKHQKRQAAIAARTESARIGVRGIVRPADPIASLQECYG